MPFGLHNALGTFHRTIEDILSQVNWQFTLVYFDDIIIFSRTADERRAMFEPYRSCYTEYFTLNLKKCKFISEKMDCLGHVIRSRGLELASQTMDEICDLKQPRTVTELKSFLGLGNLHRCFVLNFARLAAQFNSKLKTAEPKQFDELSIQEMEAVTTL